MKIPDNCPEFDIPDRTPFTEEQAEYIDEVIDGWVDDALGNQALALRNQALRAILEAGGDPSRVTMTETKGPYGTIYSFEVDG